MKRKKLSIYFDMDGVLANFDKRVKELSEIDNSWINHKGFFKELEPIGQPNETIQVLQDLGYNVYILSKVDTKGIEGNTRALDKLKWIKLHLPSIKQENVIIVPIKEDKKSYIKSDLDKSILVDDYKENLIDWCSNGGISIKFGNKWKNTRKYFQIVKDIFHVITIAESIEGSLKNA